MGSSLWGDSGLTDRQARGAWSILRFSLKPKALKRGIYSGSLSGEREGWLNNRRGRCGGLRFSVIVICVVFEVLCFHEQKSVAFTSVLP